MTKIAILGRGLTGLLSALRLKFHNMDPQTENIDVVIYFDSEIPPVPFGQGTLPNTPIELTYVNSKFKVCLRKLYTMSEYVCNWPSIILCETS